MDCPELLTVRGPLPNSRSIVTVRRDILGGIHEDIDIRNHFFERVEFQLMLATRSDFADIFKPLLYEFLSGEMNTNQVWSRYKELLDCSGITFGHEPLSFMPYRRGATLECAK
ncbi:glycogen debranching N-terminal domain-containing protein [Scytonema sp. NUACC26]|uniref:glycogen debranching N-terminal domain-containing protein n=1 Tax=Scytonema sp. NUACC26 TaxID=3140176 RepID=UPI0034DBEC02